MPIAAALLVLLAFLIPASTAGASELSSSGSVVTYTAAPGEDNSVSAMVNSYDILCGDLGAPCLQLSDGGAHITAVSGPCEVTSSGSWAGDTALCAMPVGLVADLGDRDDSMWDWERNSLIDGGPGNDTPLDGHGGDDVVIGGAGNDILLGHLGDDLLDGGPGDDALEGTPGGTFDESATHGSDLYVGGGGFDTLNYQLRTEDLTLSPDGVAGDGAAGENDDIGADVTAIYAGNGADDMHGTAGRNVFDGAGGDDELIGDEGDDQLDAGTGDDRITAGGGQDVLGGGDGDDVLDGGPGSDDFWGDEVILGCAPAGCVTGQDRIHARDGEPDAVDCGPGSDWVEADSVDVVDTAAVSPGAARPARWPAPLPRPRRCPPLPGPVD